MAVSGSIHKRAFRKRNLHVCSERTRLSVSCKSLGDGVSVQEKAYLIDFFGKDFTHYDFKFKRPVYQISRRFQCLGSKLCGAYLVFFGCRLTRRLDMKQHYGLLYMGLQIQQRVHLRLHQGKTLNSKRQYEKIQKCRPIYQKR